MNETDNTVRIDVEAFTPGRWALCNEDAVLVVDAEDITVAIAKRRRGDSSDGAIRSQVDNARRIVAAVNACAGITTASLEGLTVVNLARALEKVLESPELSPATRDHISHVLQGMEPENLRHEGRGVYVASRATGFRAQMWNRWRDRGVRITSTWIDEAGQGETRDWADLWSRCMEEVKQAGSLIFYAEAHDFPLKGALVEVGAALALGKRVFAVLPGVNLQEENLRPVGSWLRHPLVTRCIDVEEALAQAGQILSVRHPHGSLGSYDLSPVHTFFWRGVPEVIPTPEQEAEMKAYQEKCDRDLVIGLGIPPEMIR